MSNEISAVPKTIPSAINETANLMKGMGLSEKATQAVKDVAAIFSSRSVNVSNAASGASGTQDVGRASGATSIPALDNPADIKQMEAALEKLIAYLQLDNEERQAEMAKERIEVQKDTLSAEHKERKEKIDDSLKKMDEAAKSRLISRIFGWIGAIVAVAAAVAATVITGGAAAGFAIAGAVIAVSALVMSETGATDALTKALAETLESAGMSKKNAQLFAALAINIAIMALSLSCSIGGMVSGLAQISKAAADTFSTVAKVVQSACGRGPGVACGRRFGHGARLQVRHGPGRCLGTREDHGGTAAPLGRKRGRAQRDPRGHPEWTWPDRGHPRLGHGYAERNRRQDRNDGIGSLGRSAQ